MPYFFDVPEIRWSEFTMLRLDPVALDAGGSIEMGRSGIILPEHLDRYKLVVLTAQGSPLPRAPGVYRMLVVDGAGRPVPIARQNGQHDTDGIIQVGGTPTTGVLQQRVLSYARAHYDGICGKVERNGKPHV